MNSQGKCDEDSYLTAELHDKNIHEPAETCNFTIGSILDWRLVHGVDDLLPLNSSKIHDIKCS